MFKNLFKRNNSGEVIVAESKAELRGKSEHQIVEEIHESFYTEVDRLLADAKILKSTDTKYQDLIDKAAELKKLGFVNTQECKNAQLEIERLLIIKNENISKEELAKAIEYFSIEYPNSKFITEASVEKICNKYGLVYGTIDRYKGTVPTKNLNEMMQFKVKDKDLCYLEDKQHYRSYGGGGGSSKRFLGKTEFLEIISKKYKDLYDLSGVTQFSDWKDDTSIKIDTCKLEIAAPIKDFNMEGMEQVRNKLVAKPLEYDPVVLQPVFYAGKKHYIIVTAWGLEASDELVVNQKMN